MIMAHLEAKIIKDGIQYTVNTITVTILITFVRKTANTIIAVAIRMYRQMRAAAIIRTTTATINPNQLYQVNHLVIYTVIRKNKIIATIIIVLVIIILVKV